MHQCLSVLDRDDLADMVKAIQRLEMARLALVCVFRYICVRLCVSSIRRCLLRTWCGYSHRSHVVDA